MKETYDINANSEPGLPDRWILREGDSKRPDDSWIQVDVDMRDPDDMSYEDQTPRRVQIYVGDQDKLMEIITASNPTKARFFRKDLKWVTGILNAAGLELAILREADDRD